MGKGRGDVAGNRRWRLNIDRYAPVAQLAEQRTLNPWVLGSNPSGGTWFWSCLFVPSGVPVKTKGLRSKRLYRNCRRRSQVVPSFQLHCLSPLMHLASF